MDAVVINACDVVYISNIPVPISLTADVTVLNVPSLTVSLNACAAAVLNIFILFLINAFDVAPDNIVLTPIEI